MTQDYKTQMYKHNVILFLKKLENFYVLDTKKAWQKKQLKENSIPQRQCQKS